MKYQICHMSIGLFLTSAPIIAQGVFEADGVRYEIWDSAQHTVAIMPTERCGITEGYDHDNTINIVRVKSSVQNNGTGYRVVAIKDSAFTGRTDSDRLIIEESVCRYLQSYLWTVLFRWMPRVGDSTTSSWYKCNTTWNVQRL